MIWRDEGGTNQGCGTTGAALSGMYRDPTEWTGCGGGKTQCGDYSVVGQVDAVDEAAADGEFNDPGAAHHAHDAIAEEER